MVANEADLLILGVNHKQFSNISFDVLKKVMKKPILLDTRNFYSSDDLELNGFGHILLGAPQKQR